jgi:chemotaxis protein methyltransferase CheR
MEQEIDIKDIRNLVASIKNTYGFDFGEYALSSFKRRLSRILEIYKFENMQKLIDKVVSDKPFYELFLKEVTVNTTEMFRDPTFWKKMKETVFPVINDYPTIRIWHAACSSGEEVYSMAIALKEAGLYEKARIFASDINEDVILKAQEGKYPVRNMELNGFNYEKYGGTKKLTDYFKVNGDYAMMDLDLLRNVTFRKFDLVQGEQFQRFDIILCRNVLIYFNLPLQDQVVEKFAKCMSAGGFLAVGSKETIAWCKSVEHYNTFSLEEKIYQKKLY